MAQHVDIRDRLTAVSDQHGETAMVGRTSEGGHRLEGDCAWRGSVDPGDT
ncbi:hypothetical protein [Micromonospora kangleipakensis]|nr:hypothetical protein [Micromonospora kangleipakensis]